MMIGKRFVSFILAIFIAIGLFLPAAAKEDTRTAFVPVLRFIASSDTHVQDSNLVNVQRIGKMLDLGYSLAQNDAEYRDLDALIVAGDLTDDGRKTEFNLFWRAVSSALRDGTQFFGVVAKNHDGYKMTRKNLREYYTSLTGCAADFHTTINGYHFIGVSVSSKAVYHYDPDQKQWLKEQLDAAVADDPNKPVFVIHHEHVQNTVYGSSAYEGWGVSDFTDILSQYPQVVDFSGHSHYPLNDPRSVWQGEFTAIGTGAMYYSEFTIDRTRTYHPSDAYSTATCWIVEVDASNRIRLRGMDVLAGECLCEYFLDNPADPANRAFTPDAQKARSKPPVYDANAKLNVTATGYSFDIQTPAAQSADGMPVVLYRAYVKNSQGETVEEGWNLPSYYRAVEQDEVTLMLKHLGYGDYTVSVIAENAYGEQSAPIEATVHVDRTSAIKNTARHILLVIQIFFKRLFRMA